MMSAFSQRGSLQPDGYRLEVPEILLGTLAINILSLALPVMTLQLYDRILPNPGSGTLPVLLAGVCVALVLETVLRLIRGRMMLWSGASWEHRTSCAAMKHFISADLSVAGQDGVGVQLNRMGSIGKLKDFKNGYALSVLAEMVFVPLYLGLVIYIAGPLAIVPTVVLMVFTLMSLGSGQTLRAALITRDKADDARYDFLIESLEGIHTLKAHAAENIFARRYEALEESSTLSHYKVGAYMASIFNTGAVFSHIMVACVITAGALLVLQGQITSGALVATVLLSGRMMQPLQRALALWARYQDYTLSRQKVESLFEAPLSIPIHSGNTPELKEGRLALENLGLHRRADAEWIFKDANLTLAPGECLLLTGERGSGKTALLEMIAGIYPASSGSIYIDGCNVQQYTPVDLIAHVGYVATQGTIFRGTVRDNLTCFGQIAEDNVRGVASLLGVDRDVADLPSGFDTFLAGNTSDTVPPGLRQRIAIVRALATKPRLVLFDNADRGLDREGYNLIYRLLARLKGRATMILISDDENVRGLANRACILADGKLMEIPVADISGHHMREIPA